MAPTAREMFAGEEGGPKRIAFLTVTLSGHRRVAASLATEMNNRGFPVDFIIGASGVTEELRELARERPSFSLHAITGGVDLIAEIDWQRVASSSGRLGGSKVAQFQEFARITKDLSGAVEHWREMMQALEACSPDVVVLDHAHQVLQLWAETRGIPTVVLHTPYFQTGPPTGCAVVNPSEERKLEELLAVENPFAKLAGTKEELGIGGEELKFREGEDGVRAAHGNAPHTFVFCEPELLHVPELPPRVHAVGPCLLEGEVKEVGAELQPWLDAAAAAGQKVLYVAFGTLANGFLTAAAARTLLEAFAGLGEGWRVLWSLPKAQQPLLAQAGVPSALADRLRVETYVPQRAVLAHPAVQLFLTHGGQTSVNEGLAAGRPLVCLPLFCDQYEMAEAVRRHGLGLVFHKDELLAGDAGRLSALLRRVDEQPRFRELARRHARLMRARGGCSRAAIVLESIAEAGADFGELWRGVPEAELEQAAAEKASLWDTAQPTSPASTARSV